MDNKRNNKGQFIPRPISECSYKGHEKDYKREWYLKNRELASEQRKIRYQKNKERDNLSNRLWQMRNIEKSRAYKRKNKDKVRFSGNREFVLKRDNYECQICGKKDKLVIHHIDGTNNTSKMNANNKTENLITLCRSCHRKVHNELSF